MSPLPLIFKENIQTKRTGLTPLPAIPNYTTEASDAVDFICFPGIINEDVLSPEDRQNRLVEMAVKYKNLTLRQGEELLYEKVPEMMARKYRLYLRKKYPSIAKKPLLLLLTTDREHPYPISDDIFCIRTSLRRADQRKQDLSFPSPVPWIEYGGPITSSEISVGFCGAGHNHVCKSSLLQYLSHSAHCKHDFIFRRKFWGHLQGDITPEMKQSLRQEFFDILHRNIFSVSSRGRGNYSVRFYETLREGRIPVLLDSDMPLPFENEIDWKNIIICEKTPEEVEAKMLDWAENRDLVAIQNQCRKIWEEYLYLPKFLENLPLQLKSLL